MRAVLIRGIRNTILSLSLVVASTGFASTVEFERDADLVRDYPNFRINIQALWNTISEGWLGLSNPPAPHILFNEFSPDTQTAEWTAWQLAWTVEHPTIWRDWFCDVKHQCGYTPTRQEIEDYLQQGIYPFPRRATKTGGYESRMSGMFYLDTNHIQIDPQLTFYPFYRNDPFGLKSDLIGHGYYSVGHEFLHLAFDQMKIPHDIHHCVFVTADKNGIRLIERLAAYVVASKMGGSFVFQTGVQSELNMNPCNRLTDDQKKDVDTWIATLQTRLDGGSSTAQRE